MLPPVSKSRTVRKLRPHHVHAAVDRAVVGDNDLQLRLALGLPRQQRTQAGAQKFAGIVGNDGDGNIRGPGMRVKAFAVLGQDA